MARYRKAVWKPLPVGSIDPPIKPIGFILHVSAIEATSLFPGFSTRPDGIESHFHIARDGTIEQYRDTEREADANFHGNSFIKNGVRCGFISIETQGVAAGKWTPEQMASIKKLLRWGKRRHGIPLRKCPSPTEAGIGYHIMFGSPGAWTPVAKACPGPDRIKQFHNELVPWMRDLRRPKIRVIATKVVRGWAKSKELADRLRKRGFRVKREKVQ